MARPYSLDLRERVVAAVKGGGACREVAATFDVAPSTVVKWSGRQRETGSAAARPMGGKRHCPLQPQRDFLLARIAEKPDITLRELATELAERGVTVSHVSVWNLLQREGQSFKKTFTPASRTALTSRAAGPAGSGCSRASTSAA